MGSSGEEMGHKAWDEGENWGSRAKGRGTGDGEKNGKKINPGE